MGEGQLRKNYFFSFDCLNLRRKNLVTSACFEVTLEEANDINLNNAYPISDEEYSIYFYNYECL